MRKVLNFVNDNKKIIIVVVLIIILIGTIYFINKSQEKDKQTSVGTAQKSNAEIKVAGILTSIDGVGAADVMINEGDKGILGVVIVCEGADNIMTRSDILNAVSTALNVDKNLIAIYSMNN